MIKLILSICIIFLAYQASFAQGNALFAISENGLIGFINAKGEKVIPLKFVETGKFINGLAQVREGGYYGYIDTTGKYIIPPIYDFADDFKKEYHIIYGEEGTPICFNREGQRINLPNYDDFDYLENKLFKVYTHTDKEGIIDIHGKLVIDTAFSWIDAYIEDNVAIVKEYAEDNEESFFQHDKIGLIDLKGNFIVPYNRFLSIYGFKDGYAIASDTVSGNEVYIDTKGNILPLPASYILCNHKFFDRNHKDGALLVQYDDPNGKRYDNLSLGLMDTKGKLLIPHGKYDYFSDFNKGRAFVRREDSCYLINNKGELISNRAFEDFVPISSNDKLCCFVKKNGQWSILDTMGNIVFETQIKARDIYFNGIMD